MSRLYGGKYYDKQLNRRLRAKTETRDAIVWDIDEQNQLVRCKIQGSNEYILCHYPKNYQTHPYFMKRGNAVRIVHKGGQRGFLEIIGNGRAIPTAVEGDQTPPAQDLYDGIVSGGVVIPWDNHVWGVEIAATTYRINGTLYSLDLDNGYAVMGDANLGLMGASGQYELMGAGNTYFIFDDPPTGSNARYDLLVMGTDENIDYIKGTAATTPTMPSTPADHIKLCHVLLISGMTEITDAYINATFESERKLSSFTITPTSSTGTINGSGQFVWHITNNTPQCNVTAYFYDQYGHALGVTDTLTMTLSYGTGQIYSSESGWGTSPVIKTLSGQTSAAFKYERNQLAATEYSPVLTFKFANEILESGYRIQLLDSGGGLIS